MRPWHSTEWNRAVALLAALCLLVAPGCRKPAPIKVGFVAGLTGRNSSLGVSSRNAAVMAVEEFNAKGGIAGRPLELIIRDDEQQPEAARRSVEELIRLGVVAIIGHNTSSMAEVTLPIADREHVLMISPTVSSAQFLGKDDWLVMLFPSTSETAKSLAGYVARTDAARRITAFYDLNNAAFTRTLFESFKAEHERHGAGWTVRGVPFTSGQVVSFSDLVGEALKEPADGVLVIATALDSASLCQQVRKRSAVVRLFGTDWGFTNDVLANGGSALEGAIFTQKVDMASTVPAFVAFKQAYFARYNRQADFAAVLSYEAVEVLATGLRKDQTREGVRRAVLEIGTHHGLQADIQIDRYGDTTRRHVITTVRNGQMANID